MSVVVGNWAPDEKCYRCLGTGKREVCDTCDRPGYCQHHNPRQDNCISCGGSGIQPKSLDTAIWCE